MIAASPQTTSEPTIVDLLKDVLDTANRAELSEEPGVVSKSAACKAALMLTGESEKTRLLAMDLVAMMDEHPGHLVKKLAAIQMGIATFEIESHEGSL